MRPQALCVGLVLSVTSVEGEGTELGAKKGTRRVASNGSGEWLGGLFWSQHGSNSPLSRADWRRPKELDYPLSGAVVSCGGQALPALYGDLAIVVTMC